MVGNFFQSYQGKRECDGEGPTAKDGLRQYIQNSDENDPLLICTTADLVK